MSFLSLVKRWFGKRQGTIRNSPHGPLQTRKKIAAGKSVKLMLEILEDRLAPASVSLVGSTLVFTASTSVAETITVTAPSPNTLQIDISDTADTLSLGAGTTGSDFTLTGNSLEIGNVNLSGGPAIQTISVALPNNVALPNSTAFSDTLNFGLANNAAGIQNVYIAGPNVSPDSQDTVSLNALSISGNLEVWGGTINFQGAVQANYILLTSVNSMTFPSTGVPYLGPVTINTPPPQNQPFAGDTYITGPDWGAYGYAPGDEITIANANNVTPAPTTYTVEAIVGDNLYLNSALPSDAAGNDSAVTVACAGFNADIQTTGPAPSLTLDVTGPGALDLRCN
jgi:hypothetical protein